MKLLYTYTLKKQNTIFLLNQSLTSSQTPRCGDTESRSESASLPLPPLLAPFTGYRTKLELHSDIGSEDKLPDVEFDFWWWKLAAAAAEFAAAAAAAAINAALFAASIAATDVGIETAVLVAFAKAAFVAKVLLINWAILLEWDTLENGLAAASSTLDGFLPEIKIF